MTNSSNIQNKSKTEVLLREINKKRNKEIDNSELGIENFNIRGAVRELHRHGHSIKLLYKSKNSWRVVYTGSQESINEGLGRIDKRKERCQR